MARRPLVLISLCCMALLAGCGDDAPNVTGATEPTINPISGGPWLRLANLSGDLDEGRVRLDGRVFRERISYPQVTSYEHIEPGTHRITFVPPPKTAIDPRTVELDTMFSVASGDVVTVVAAGLAELRTLRVAAIRDDPAPSREGARIRLINAMSDFPAPLDLWQNRRTALVRRVEYVEEAPYRSLEAGNHPLEVRRSGTSEPVVPVVPYGLARNAVYTMFAFGTLRQENLDARLVLDGTEGFLTHRR
ncbi:MAG: DUF4397 domain-containing protein [Vicinamibacteria bacterium]